MSAEMLVEEILMPEQQETIDTIIAAHRNETGALIPVLQEVQGEFGFLSQPVLRAIAERMKIPFSEVTGVVTFYSYFNTSPRGKHAVRVCLGTACYVRNGKQVLADLKKELGIDVGETTENRTFTLEIGRCFGACGLAPVLMVNDDVHQRVKPARLRELLAQYRDIESIEEVHK
jgi:NADH:ubiquinone oxidoreductase subunit E